MTDSRREKYPGELPMLVQIALHIPSNQTFTYRVPPEWQKNVAVGMRAIVPFGRAKKTGVIVDIGESHQMEIPLKDIISLLDTEPLFGTEELRFYRWAAEYYLYPLGKALGEILPGGEKKSANYIQITPLGLTADDHKLSPTQQEILEIIKNYPRGLTTNALKKKTKSKHLDHAISRLREKGLIEIHEKMTGRQAQERTETLIYLSGDAKIPPYLTSGQNKVVNVLKNQGPLTYPQLMHLAGVERGVIDRLWRKRLLVKKKFPISVPSPMPHDVLTDLGLGNVILNDYQQRALEQIINGIEANLFSPFLLHGVTGSGKTEIYLRAIDHVLRHGGGILYLVPEIGLTPQLLGRLQGRFPGEKIAVLHSGIPDQTRYENWRALKRGEIRLACGARSAIFAPVQNLRLIIVDEEHDESYKQEERFPYNARDLALLRAQMQRATVILGSATPAIHTYHLAQKGRYTLLSLPSRVERRPLPLVQVVDMRLTGQKGEIISAPLREAMTETLREGRQIMLFLNRRGFHNFLLCRRCGYTFKCPNCDLALTFHSSPGHLVCHYCDHALNDISLCPQCAGRDLIGFGLGTEKVQEAVTQMFPSARVSRLDRDTAEKPAQRSQILKSIWEGNTDIIIGTQMLSKGHDFPNITLVGVICADISLNLPDFRAGERTFQLLTQVAGRGGRGDVPGRVIIQTFNPDHYVIKNVQGHDYLSFYEREITGRAELKYPPFSRLLCLQMACANKDRGWAGAQALGKHIRSLNVPGIIEFLGPAPAPLSRLRGRYRWQMIVKGKDPHAIRTVAQAAQNYPLTPGFQLRCDIDPINFM